MSNGSQADTLDTRPHLVIVGGGFAGLHVARGLAKAPVRITLIDRNNHHLFQPLLYQVATAVLSPADISQPIRRMFRDQANVRVVMGTVTSIDLANHSLRTDDFELSYDYLVLACGATHSYFGHTDWETLAPGLKTLDDALNIRHRVLLAFEAAELEADPMVRRRRLTFAVVGGGPTGVELAGALKEIATRTIARDFRSIDTTTASVILIEAQDRLLPTMSPRSSQRALKDFQAMGVDVRLNTRVVDLTAEGVVLEDGMLPCAHVFWAAGVQASELGQHLKAAHDRAGRVMVNADLSLAGHPNVFVIGDMAHVQDQATGHMVPGVAQAAMQMGDHVARLLRAELDEAPPHPDRPPFVYRDKGTMATIGKARAVADIGGRHVGGLAAWLIWSLVHVLFLIGFRNKLFVVLGWIWNYLSDSKGARLITGQPRMDLKAPGPDKPANP